MALLFEAPTNPTHTVWLSAAVLLAVALTYSIGLVSPSTTAAAIAKLTLEQSWWRRPRCNAIDITPSLLERIRWVGGMTDAIHRAYAATGRGAFQYTTLSGRRQLVLCSDKLIAELAQAPPDTLNFRAWVMEVITSRGANWRAMWYGGRNKPNA